MVSSAIGYTVLIEYTDATAMFPIGSRIWIDDGFQYNVRYVANSVYAGGDTTLTLGSEVDSDVYSPCYGYPAVTVQTGDSVDIYGKSASHVVPLGLARLWDESGGGSFTVVDDFECPDVEVPLICATTKDGNVPILLDVGVVVAGSNAFTNSGLVDVGAASTFTSSSGYGVVNTGTIVGFSLVGVGLSWGVICTSGDIECDHISGESSATEGIYLDGGTLTGGITAISAGTLALVNNMSTINLIGALVMTPAAYSNTGTIQSAYDLPPTDILGAGML